MAFIVLIRGGGDLASGVSLRLHRAGLQVLITELPQPRVCRRAVSFAEAIYQGQAAIEGAKARRVDSPEEIRKTWAAGEIPVLVDPEAKTGFSLQPSVLVDGRMTKQPPEIGLEAAELVIGLGPGFTAGLDCHAVVETRRGHTLGQVIWDGPPEADTGVPETVGAFGKERVLRAPVDGQLIALAQIGDRLAAGQPVASVGGQVIVAPFQGVLRGLVFPGLEVKAGMKVGDIDPRNDPSCCFMVSDKALAVGGGVVEAILSRANFRSRLWL
jgi:xanthine dehydrogenase accessory factor